MQIATAVAATARSRRRGQAAQTPGTMDPSRCLRLPLSAGRPRRALSARLVDDYGLTRFVPQAEADACSTALAATAGPGPRLAQHRSTHKACHYLSNFLTIHPHNGILPFLLEGDWDDGEKTEDLTAAFRREFRASLLVASCKGLADMLLAAGMPFAGKRGPGWSSASGGSAHAPPPSLGRDLEQRCGIARPA